jgi:predicted  nucleic acid-binding Zn-ribbon protein
MLSQDPIRPWMKLSCTCGGDVRVDPHSQERKVDCPKCGMPIHFVVSIDPLDRKRSKVSLVLPLTAVKAEGESLGTIIRKIPLVPKSAEPKTVAPKTVGRKTVVRKTVAPRPGHPGDLLDAPEPEVSAGSRSTGRATRGVLADCPCGQSFPVDESDLASLQYCPGCGIRYHVVVKLEKGTRKKVALLVPAKVMGQRDARSAAVPKPSAAGRKTVRVPKAAPPSASSAPLPPGAQAVSCFCGATLVVRRKDVSSGMICPSCRRKVDFAESRDPQTLAPILRLRED